MSQKMRLDLFLVAKGWASSRTHAQDLIESGQVFLVDGSKKKSLLKSSLPVEDGLQIVVESGPANRFVSRGGLKLEGALLHTGLNVSGMSILDVGISTGGFTDCLLQQEAGFVLGVDVGHGQVHPTLLANSRLKVIEGVNARALSQNPEVQEAVPPGQFDLIVMDVSFISILLILPELVLMLKPGGQVLSLVKPQFEVGVDGLAKGGIVKDTGLFSEVESRVKEKCHSLGLSVLDYFSSSIQGKDGNNEFFVLAKKDLDPRSF